MKSKLYLSLIDTYKEMVGLGVSRIPLDVLVGRLCSDNLLDFMELKAYFDETSRLRRSSDSAIVEVTNGK